MPSVAVCPKSHDSSHFAKADKPSRKQGLLNGLVLLFGITPGAGESGSSRAWCLFLGEAPPTKETPGPSGSLVPGVKKRSRMEPVCCLLGTGVPVANSLGGESNMRKTQIKAARTAYESSNNKNAGSPDIDMCATRKRHQCPALVGRFEDRTHDLVDQQRSLWPVVT